MTEQPDGGQFTCVAVEIVTEKLREQLQILDMEVDHVLHFLRSDISNLTLKNITGFERGDSEQSYRVKNFKDDPQSLKVLFFCVAA